MARSLAAAALLAAAAFANPLAYPNGNPHVALTVRQEAVTTSSTTSSASTPEPTLGVGPVSEGEGVTTHTPTSCEVKTTGGTLLALATTATLPDRLVCLCDSSIQVSASSRRAPDGAVSYFCNALGPWSTSAVSVSIPTGTPGDPNNEAWAQVKCDYGSLVSNLNNPLQQWNDSSASAAYADAVEAFKLDNKGVGFAAFISDFFHARPGTGCDRIDEPNCDVTMSCGQGGDPNADVSSPAGYIIMNSIVGLHSMYDRLWRGIDGARTNVLFSVGTFVETLSPINEDIKDQRELKIALDGIQIGLTLLVSKA